MMVWFLSIFGRVRWNGARILLKRPVGLGDSWMGRQGASAAEGLQGSGLDDGGMCLRLKCGYAPRALSGRNR